MIEVQRSMLKKITILDCDKFQNLYFKIVII